MATQIKFGTDGWRGIIADDFTFDNVRRVGNAMATYVHKHEDASKGLVVGYDTRFVSKAGGADHRRSTRRLGHRGTSVERLHADSGAVLRGEESGHGRRRDDHLQPQSIQLEWREIQGLVTADQGLPPSCVPSRANWIRRA